MNDECRAVSVHYPPSDDREGKVRSHTLCMPQRASQRKLYPFEDEEVLLLAAGTVA